MATLAVQFQSAPLRSKPSPALTLVPAAPYEPGARFSDRKSTNWRVVGVVAAAHVALGALLLATGTVRLPAPEKPVMVSMIPDLAPPSPPQQVDIPLDPVPVEVFIPDVLVESPIARPTPIAVTNLPAPPKVVPPPSVATSNGSPVAAPVTPPDFDADQLDNPAPRYPALSRRNHEQGTSTLKVLVSPDGRAEQLAVATSSGFSRLDAAALDTVKRWKFLPAKQAGKPVAAWVLVPVTFALG